MDKAATLDKTVQRTGYKLHLRSLKKKSIRLDVSTSVLVRLWLRNVWELTALVL